jgi:hypothetical protein
MTGRKFVLKKDTLAILSENGGRVAVTVPEDAIVEIPIGDINGDRLVNVHWQGKVLTMFTQDIHDRGEQVHSQQ